MAKFMCNQCNYRFEFDMNRIPNLCPNCGGTDSVSKEKTAEELVDESD